MGVRGERGLLESVLLFYTALSAMTKNKRPLRTRAPPTHKANAKGKAPVSADQHNNDQTPQIELDPPLYSSLKDLLEAKARFGSHYARGTASPEDIKQFEDAKQRAEEVRPCFP